MLYKTETIGSSNNVLHGVGPTLLANVIMLNILIAMFNHSYERVKDRSMKINAFPR